jgi:non-homologous end joining protein Ku
MRGDNHLLALTTAVDEVTKEVKPLFALPVQVCKATDSDDVKFEIAAPSGAERKQAFIDTATGEVVDDAKCLRGIRIGEEFKVIDPDAIEQINEATKLKTMVVLGSLPLDEARVKYGNRTTGTYFIQSPAKGGSPKAYRLVMESLREKRQGKKVVAPARALVTKRTARSRQKLALIYVDENGGKPFLRMEEIEFANKVREPDAQVLAPLTAEVDEAQIEMARKVIDKMPDGNAAIESEVDEAVTMKRELIEKAVAGETIVAPAKIAETVEADNLMANLEASLAAAE